SDGKKTAFIMTYDISPLSDLFALVPYQASAGGRQAVLRSESSSGDITYTVISKSGLGVYATENVSSVVLSPDANYALFSTAADNLTAGDTDGISDLFLKNLSDGTMVRIEKGTPCAFSDDSSEFLF